MSSINKQFPSTAQNWHRLPLPHMGETEISHLSNTLHSASQGFAEAAETMELDHKAGSFWKILEAGGWGAGLARNLALELQVQAEESLRKMSAHQAVEERVVETLWSQGHTIIELARVNEGNRALAGCPREPLAL